MSLVWNLGLVICCLFVILLTDTSETLLRNAAYTSFKKIGTPGAVSAVKALDYEYIWADYLPVKKTVLPGNHFDQRVKSLEDNVKLMVLVNKTGGVTRAYVFAGKYRALNLAAVKL